MGFLETIKKAGLNKVLDYFDKDPETNIPKIMGWIKTFDRSGRFDKVYKGIEEVTQDPNNNWNKLIKSIWTDFDRDVRRTTFRNFLVNSAILGNDQRYETEKKYDCNVPWAILLDPTSACNLLCTGCWAAEYGHKLNLSYEELDNIITQGKAMGTYMYIYTGGEPLVRKKDIIRLCEKHDDCEFLCFTNGTLIDEEFADEMLRVKNFVPAISVEGFEKATDSRRGEGTYKAIERAMAILKKKKLIFGVSCCYTKYNAQDIGSEAFFDDLIEKGVKFAWFFTFMPVGADSGTELMATAEQREFMYRQIRTFRRTKPLLTMDFWNDGEYVGGCIAAGRKYLHINANGDIEPCVFAHYSDSNIREKTLLEAYCSPLFMAYRHNQPFSDNLLRPCPILDNPGRLAKMVDETGAKSTDLQNPEDVHELCGKCAEAAGNWKPKADRLWNFEEGHSIGLDGMNEKDEVEGLHTGYCGSCQMCQSEKKD